MTDIGFLIVVAFILVMGFVVDRALRLPWDVRR